MADAWYYILVFVLFGGVFLVRGNYLSDVPASFSPMATFLFWGMIVFLALKIARSR